MNRVQYYFWYILSFLSLSVAVVFFSISQFVELQFGNSKLAVPIFLVILVIGSCSFMNKAESIRTKMVQVSIHHSHWIVKAIVEFTILAFVTMLTVFVKHPHFMVSDKQEDRSIFAIRAYCQNPNCPDPQIKALCSNFLEQQNSKQGDQMGFFSAVAFSLHIFSTSLLLNLPEEYGLFYMCVELTMNAAVEIPGIGGSILNWYYVGPTALYCFGLIIVRCYYHSSDEVRRRGGNGGDHDHGNDGDDRDRRPRQAVRDRQAGGVAEELPGMGNQQGDGDDGEEVGGGVGERKTGDQGHRIDPGSAGCGWEILSFKEGDEHKAERDEGTSSDDKIKRISTTRRKQAAPVLDVSSDQRKFQNHPPMEIPRRHLFAMLMSTNISMLLPPITSVPLPESIGVIYISCLMITGALLWGEFWITCKHISHLCFGLCLTVFKFGFRFVTCILRQLGLELNRDSHDGADGGGGGGKTVDQGHRVGSDQENMPAKEGDEHKAERDEGKSFEDILHLNLIKLLYGVAFAIHVRNISIFIIRFGDGTFWDSVGKAMLLIIGSLLGNVVLYLGLGFVTRILRQHGWVLNQEEDSHDVAKGGGGGSKTADQGHSAGSGREIVSAEEAEEHEAGKTESSSSESENEKISSTSNVLHGRVIIMRRKQAVPSDQEKFPANKADSISDKKSAATGFNFFGKSLKFLSPRKQDYSWK